MAEKEWKSEAGGFTIKIDMEKCNGCGNCVTACPVGVFELKDEKSEVVKIDECIECCACVPGCGENAINHSSC